MNNLNKKAIKTTGLTNLDSVEFVGFNKEQSDNLPRRFEGSDLQSLIDTSAQSAVDSNKSYKVYTALLTQESTGIPTAVVMENTLGGAVTFTYTSVGSYKINSSTLFTTDKTTAFTGQNYGATGDTTTYINLSTESQMSIETYAGGVLQNDNLYNTFIEIRVYN